MVHNYPSRCVQSQYVSTVHSILFAALQLPVVVLQNVEVEQQKNNYDSLETKMLTLSHLRVTSIALFVEDLNCYLKLAVNSFVSPTT